jgi:hypothetical protein
MAWSTDENLFPPYHRLLVKLTTPPGRHKDTVQRRHETCIRPDSSRSDDLPLLDDSGSRSCFQRLSGLETLPGNDVFPVLVGRLCSVWK